MPDSILFFAEDVAVPSFVKTHKKELRNWIKKITRSEKKGILSLTYIFCSDTYLLNINKQYLDHTDYTDIITFDYATEGLLHADIFISTERVKENARHLQVTYRSELLRVMAHGVLHLCGYADKTAAQQKIMRSKENACIGKWA